MSVNPENQELIYILNKAFWLKMGIKSQIFHALEECGFLTKEERAKLCKILCSIPYAEDMICKEKVLVRFLKRCMKIIPILKRLCNTLSPWDFSVRFAQNFFLSEKEFRHKLNSNEAIFFVIDYLVSDINLKKEPERILAEYAICEEATTIAAIQKGFNLLLMERIKPLAEDGIFGPMTSEACNFFHLESGDQKKYDEVLKFLEKKTLRKLLPFIPETVSKRGWRYLFRAIKRREWKKTLNIFKSHVNVPLYISSGMKAYSTLEN